MRGGDAGWGHKQGEAEEEKGERESPALEYTATTRLRDTQTLAFFFFIFYFVVGRRGQKKRKGALRRCGYELKKTPLEEALTAFSPRKN